jgi:hypothetical protein
VAQPVAHGVDHPDDEGQRHQRVRSSRLRLGHCTNLSLG